MAKLSDDVLLTTYAGTILGNMDSLRIKLHAEILDRMPERMGKVDVAAQLTAPVLCPECPTGELLFQDGNAGTYVYCSNACAAKNACHFSEKISGYKVSGFRQFFGAAQFKKGGGE